MSHRSSGSRLDLDQMLDLSPMWWSRIGRCRASSLPHDINWFRIAALSLDDYSAGLVYMAGVAHDAWRELSAAMRLANVG
jgi:hypothetical protein